MFEGSFCFELNVNNNCSAGSLLVRRIAHERLFFYSYEQLNWSNVRERLRFLRCTENVYEI